MLVWIKFMDFLTFLKDFFFFPFMGLQKSVHAVVFPYVAAGNV